MSNDSIQPVDEMNEWVVNIEDRLNNTTEEIPPTKPPIDSNGPSIYGNWKCLKDFGDASFLLETKKWHFVAFMKRWCGLNVRSYLEEFQKKEDDVWSYYERVDEQFRVESYNKCFIEHLLANSCFLIFAMVILTHNNKNEYKILREFDERNDTNNQRIKEFENLKICILDNEVGTKTHMLTMDYQIPWFVVEAVYTNHSNLSKLFDSTPIHKLALSCLNYFNLETNKSKVNDDTITLPLGGFKHLLHIFHWTRTPKRKYQVPLKALPVLRKMDHFYIPSATELQLSTTVFEGHNAGGIDVSFYERILSGVMQLRSWYLPHECTEIYKNLLAFERGYGMVCGFPVTAYVACMVCLLQTEADVRQLQDNGIIFSQEDEKDVLSSLQCFKSTVLSNDIPMSLDLMSLSWNVRKHHERNSTRFYGEFKSRYCSNSWITISVIAGFLLFVLTFIQTLYGTLSYYKQ